MSGRLKRSPGVCAAVTNRPRLSRLGRRGCRVAALALAALIFGAAQPAALLAQSTEPAPVRLPDAHVGDDVTLQLGAEGAPVNTVWRVSPETALPPGVTLEAASGRLRVRPTTARIAPYIFTIEVAESDDGPALFSQAYSLRVSGPVRRITVSAVNAGGGVPTVPLRAGEVGKKDDCPEPIDVESNSDTIDITVRDEYNYIDEKGVRTDHFKLDDKKKPIAKPKELIDATIGKCYKDWKHDDHVIIHLVKWPERDPPARAGNPVKYEPQKEKWFLFRNASRVSNVQEWVPETVQEGTRIYGRRRVAVLLVHLTARENWDIKYTVDVKGKIPAPLQNVIDLAGIILGGAAPAGAAEVKGPPSYWGGRLLLLKDVPADIAVKSNIAFLPSAEVVAGMAAAGEPVSKDQQTQQPKNYEKVYDNEGRYHWDVSVGLPVKGFKEVKYDAENGQVTAREVNRQNAYGFLNLFFNPNGVDTKGAEFYKTPHLVLGVPISGKPLDRPMVGLGIGSYKTGFKFNLFGGAVFNRVREPRTLAAGQAATPAQLEADFETRRVTKFIFGFNIPVRQFKDAIAPKK